MYKILLINNKAKAYSYITLMILLLNAAIFGNIYSNPASSHLETISRFGLILSIVYILIYLIRRFTKYMQRYKLEIAFLVLGVLWLVAGNITFSFIMFVCAITGLYAGSQSKIIFNTDQVIYPSLPTTKSSWNELNNVILKDEVLTIDFKNNKIFQSKILPETATTIDVKAFNAFCQEQLSANPAIVATPVL